MKCIHFEEIGNKIEKLENLLNNKSLQMKSELIRFSDLSFLLDCRFTRENNDSDEVFLYRVNQEDIKNIRAGKKAETSLSVLKSVKDNIGEEDGYQDFKKTGMMIELMGDKYVVSPEAYTLMAALVHKDFSGEYSFYKNMYLIELLYEDPSIYSLLYQSEVYIDKYGKQHQYRKVYGIAKSRYMPSLDLFKEVVRYIHDDLGLNLKKWVVTNELRTVEFTLPKYENITPILVIQDSDCMASSFVMRMEYHIGRSYMIGDEIPYKHTKRIANKPYKEDIAALIADAVNHRNEVEKLATKPVKNLEQAGSVIKSAIAKISKDQKVNKVFAKNSRDKFIGISIDNVSGNFDEMTEKDVLIPVIKSLCSMQKNEVDLNYIRKASRLITK